MNNQGPKKIYVSYDPSKGYPAGRNLYYECLVCGDSIPSLPADNMGCRYGNVFIDIDYGRLVVRNDDMLRAYTIDTV